MTAAPGPFATVALSLGAHGLPAFPVQALGKKPAVRGWQRLATTDPARLTAQSRRHGKCNVGIATGRGLLVIDVDTKNGRDGRASLRDLQAEHGPLPVTVTACTPTGGAHLYFRTRGQVHLSGSVDRLGPGLDVRGDGNLVVAPPSFRADGVYAWLPGHAPGELAIADLPAAWLALLCTQEPAGAATGGCAPTPSETSRYGAAAVAGEASRVATAPEGRRNSTLVRSAFKVGQLVASGHVNDREAAAVLDSAATAVGLDDPKERRRTIRSGLTAGRRHPRRAAPPAGAAPVPALTIATLDAVQPTWRRGNHIATADQGYLLVDHLGQPVPGIGLPVAGLDQALVASIGLGLGHLSNVVGFRVLHFLVCTAHRQWLAGVRDFHRLEFAGAWSGLASAASCAGCEREVRAVVLALAHLSFRVADGWRGNLVQYEEPIAPAPGRRAVLVLALGGPLLPRYAKTLPAGRDGLRQRRNRWLVPLLPALPRLDALPARLQSAGVRLHLLFLRELASQPRALAELGGMALDRKGWRRLATAAGLPDEYLSPLLAVWQSADLCPAFLAEPAAGVWTLGPEHAPAVRFILRRLEIAAERRRRAGHAR